MQEDNLENQITKILFKEKFANSQSSSIPAIPYC